MAGGRLTFLALIMLMTVIVGMVLAHRTCFGNRVYAIGGNITSAELMGVRVRKTTIQIYMLSRTLAVLSGIVFSLYTSAGYALAASGVELDAIAAVVIWWHALDRRCGYRTGDFLWCADSGADSNLHHL